MSKGNIQETKVNNSIKDSDEEFDGLLSTRDPEKLKNDLSILFG